MKINIERKQDTLLKSLLQFYSKDTNMKTFANVATNEHDLSRRILDFLCTNYAKKYHLMYYITDSQGKKKAFNLYLQYRNQLKAYSKMLFDPFRRHERIIISCPFTQTGKLETTVAQMNFFKWLIENNVLEWIQNPKNMKDVENEMALYLKEKKQTKAKNKSKNNVIRQYNVNVTVRFT